MTPMKWAVLVIAVVLVPVAAFTFLKKEELPPSLFVAGKSIDPYQHGLVITAAAAISGCSDNCEIMVYTGHTDAEVRVSWRVETVVPTGRSQPAPLPAIRGIVCQETGKPEPDFTNCTIPFDVVPGVIQEGSLPAMLNEFVQDPYGVKAHLALWVGGKPQLSERSPPMAKMATTMSVIPVIHQ